MRGCITNFWTLGGELRLRIPVRLPRVFEKDTAQGEEGIEEGIEVGDIPAHAGSFNAGGGQLFARTLNRPRTDEVPTLPLRPVAHAGGMLLKVVQNGGQSGAEVEKVLQMRNDLRHVVL
jgi:hypothetical protein